jgi:hypothetical protein
MADDSKDDLKASHQGAVGPAVRPGPPLRFPHHFRNTVSIIAANVMVFALAGRWLIYPLFVSPTPEWDLPVFKTIFVCSLIGSLISYVPLLYRKRYPRLQQFALACWICLIPWFAVFLVHLGGFTLLFILRWAFKDWGGGL